jgi:hypothetical protein
MVAGNNQISGLNSDTEQRDILKLSHGTAIILLFSEFDPAVVILPLGLRFDALSSPSLRFIPRLPAGFP